MNIKNNKKIIINFNRLLANELAVANRYFLNSRIFRHWGFIRLSDIEYQESLDEMNHADCYVKRILFLSGVLCGVQDSNVFKNSKNFEKDNVEEILRSDLDVESNIVNDLRECISYSDSVHDFVSRDIMVNILIDEEKHVDFLETEIALIVRIGVHNYLQSQLR